MANQDQSNGRPRGAGRQGKGAPPSDPKPPAERSTAQPFAKVTVPARPATREAQAPAEPNLFELKTELVRVPIEDDSKLQPAQQRVLREVARKVMGALVRLGETREAASTTESTPEQRYRHASDFLECFPLNLIQPQVTQAQAARLDLSYVDKALEEFRLEYLQTRCSDGSTPMPAHMIGKAGSILQSVLYPALPVEADMVLTRVERGVRSLESRDRDGYVMFGTRLAWSVMLMQPDILNPSGPRQGQPLLDPKLVHRLAMVPLHQSVEQVKKPAEIRKLDRFIASLPPGSGSDGPWQEDLQVFSQIFHQPIYTQPFYEGNHRTGWILANQWLLQNCGAYIPWDRELSDHLKDIARFKGSDLPFAPNFVESYFRYRHQKVVPQRFAEHLEEKVQLVKDL
jgi:hypothetical protein